MSEVPRNVRRATGSVVPMLPDAAVGAAGPLPDFKCLRCGHQVLPRPWGCKNPCRNCGFVYPLGDCSD